MFERFTREARQIVTGAVAEAGMRGDSRVGSEHLLIATMGASFHFDRSILGPLDVGQEGIREQVARMDSESLVSVGLDPNVLHPSLSAGAGPKTARGHLPFTHGAKAVLKGSLQEAIDRGDRHIGVEHVLLALLAVPKADPVSSVLAYLEADPVGIRAGVEASLRRAS